MKYFSTICHGCPERGNDYCHVSGGRVPKEADIYFEWDWRKKESEDICELKCPFFMEHILKYDVYNPLIHNDTIRDYFCKVLVSSLRDNFVLVSLMKDETTR